MTPEEVVGRRIVEFRERLGITQQQLGERLAELLGRGWPRQTVSAAEKGKRAFTAAELFALAFVLDTWASRLLVPPAGEAVVMPSGATIDGAAGHSREASYQLLDRAEAALRRVVTDYEQRIDADRAALADLAPLYEALRTLTVDDTDNGGNRR